MGGGGARRWDGRRQLGEIIVFVDRDTNQPSSLPPQTRRYGPDGLLREEYIKRPISIHECNSLCACGPSCVNRQVQLGPSLPLEVFHTADKGCGLRCKVAIPKGRFVIEYVGEVLTSKEIEEKRLDSPEAGLYSWDIEPQPNLVEESSTKSRAPLVIDPSRIGNCARFVNHSCSPNLIGMEVYIDGSERKRVAFFTKRKVSKGAELTVDYHYRIQACPGVIMPCRCGSNSCDGVLY